MELAFGGAGSCRWCGRNPAPASATRTLVKATLPALVTLMVKLGVPPDITVWVSAAPSKLLSILMLAVGTDNTVV